MEELAIPILIAMLAAAGAIFLGSTGHIRFPGWMGRSALQDWVRSIKSSISGQKTSPLMPTLSKQPDLGVLNCRVQLTRLKEDNCIFDAFIVEIAGTIHTLAEMLHTTLLISITDVTEGVRSPQPVNSRIKQWQMSNSPVFCFSAELGKLPQQDTILSEWTTVAQLHLDWLVFPHKGSRDLRFYTSILSHQSGKELASAVCNVDYENLEYGYIDLQENIQRSKTLAVALAFAVSAVDGKIYDGEVEIIKSWARGNLDLSQASQKARHKLEKALNKTVAFFSHGNQLDTHKICREIVELVPLAERYDILDLCLHVAKANGIASAEEIALLKSLANWLEVDNNRFRNMVEKILPVGMHEVRDEEVVLGVSSDMSKEKTRLQLNKEYNKWNARVTNSDPEIQSQADQMLKLIAEARSAYIG
ncbi:MAG: tellurite resistance TerB family protein [Planctomycetota bacterium]|jgi:tellurite resistance protein